MSAGELNGGPAFPGAGPAHPQPSGMTQRDYFAAKAMQGFLANAHLAKREPMCGEDMAKAAYQLADAMLIERAQ